MIEREADREQWPAIHVVANEAVWDRDVGWTLNQGFYRTFPPGAEQRAFAFDKLLLPAVTETPEDLLAEPKEPAMSTTR